MGLFETLRAKLEIYRLEQRYTRRDKRSTWVSGAQYVNGEYVYGNGDLAVYLDLTFTCSWVAGEPYVGDDESVDVGWWPLDGLPDTDPWMAERIEAALSREVAARFRAG